VFGWFVTIEEFPARMAAALTSVSEDPVVLLLAINLLLLAVGTVIETTAALILFVPVIMPLLPVLGVDVVHLGAIVVVNLALGMLTPPLGICLIVSCGLAGTRLGEISVRVLPFFVVLVADLILITFLEPLTMWLPGLIY
jgi:TRAP-type C4-dicarboxylate transport system permease large subunit